jgi:hypothetical protein
MRIVSGMTSVLVPLASAAVLATCPGVRAQALPSAPGDSGVLPEITVRGIYRLSNGWTLSVNPDWRRVIAQIDQRGPVELVPLSPDRFVSADGRMAMEFNLGVQGDEMVLRYVPDGASAHVVTATATLARR